MQDIARQLDDKLKEAMKARDTRTSDLVRMVKTKMMERRTSKGFSGEVNDALWLDVIATYAKSLEKAIAEFDKLGGDAAKAQGDGLKWELDWLAQFLPKRADEATTRGWVEAAIAGLGGKEKAKVGAVMGAVMKGHKDDVDANLVRKLAEQLLT